MAILAKDNRPDREPAPEGLHPAVCVDVVDLGMIKSSFEGKTSERHMVRLVWQIEDVDTKGRRFTPMQQYTLSLNSKAKLRQHLEAWRSKKFAEDELKNGFDLERLINVPCQLQVVHNLANDGNTYANVAAIVPLGKGMLPLRAEGYVRMKDREEMKKDAFGNGESGEPGQYGKDDDDGGVPF